MSRYSELKNKLAHLLGRPGFDHSLHEELHSHLELRIDELVANGMSRAEAMTTARREFGSTTRIAEDSREAWRWSWCEDLGRDLRYAARALSRDRRFALTAIVSLALGVGVNTTVFSLATSFLLNEPSVRNPDAIVHVQLGGRSQVQMREYRFLQDAGVFAALVGMDEDAELNWRSGEVSKRLFGIRVTDNFFRETHMPVATGRPMAPGERDVVVVSDLFWKTHLQGDAGALGRVMILDGEPHTVIGVLPPNHRTLIGLGFAPDLYVPVRNEAARLRLYGIVPAGATLQDMTQRLKSAGSQLDQIYPDPDVKWAQLVELDHITGINRFVTGKRSMRVFAQFFLMLMIVVGLLLMIACTNVASLLLARAAGRTREFGVRLSIGATRGRLIRQLLAESLFLSMLGAAAGLAINSVLTNGLNGLLLPLPVPIRLALEPDWRLLAYGSLIAVVCAVMAGLLPALTSTRTTNASLKQDEHQVGSSARLRKTLVAAQLAVSVIILVTATLFARNLLRSTSMDPGFDLHRTTWAHMRLVPESYPTADRTFALVSNALERVRAMPGVESASYTNVVPLNDSSNNNGQVTGDTGKGPVSMRYQTFIVSEDYFKTMGIRIVAGREFAGSDRRGGPRLVILNEAFAKTVFGSVPPVGRTVRFGGNPSTIIGVAANSKYVTLGEDEAPAIYEPYLAQQGNRANLSFLIRTTGSPSALTHSLNRELLAVDRSAAVEVKPMNQAMGFALLPSRAGAGLLGVIGALGLTLASIGLFGVLSYAVSRRVREIGLRVALGAGPGHILRLVLGEGAWILGPGLTAGILAAIFLTKPLALFLVAGLSPSDPLTYIAVATILIVVGCLASVKPAIRALQADPAVALRSE